MPSPSTKTLDQLTKAVLAIQTGKYTSDYLAGILDKPGQLGQLARVMDTMAHNMLLLDHQLRLLQRVIPVGVALSAEKDFNRLLETLVIEAQTVTNADAGTLYLLEGDTLRFVIVRNSSLDLAMGGTSGKEISFPTLPLHREDGTQNTSNVATYVALNRKPVNLADAYEAAGFDFSGTRQFDERTGYRSKSFLTIPLTGHAGEVIGVLQLINARGERPDQIIPFHDDNVLDALISLASAALDGYICEEKLRQEIAKLRIEIDETRRATQVAEITDTAYFKELRDRAREMRSKLNSDG